MSLFVTSRSELITRANTVTIFHLSTRYCSAGHNFLTVIGVGVVPPLGWRGSTRVTAHDRQYSATHCNILNGGDTFRMAIWVGVAPPSGWRGSTRRYSAGRLEWAHPRFDLMISGPGL